MDTQELLAQGIQAAQRGFKDKAREMLNLVIIAEPRNETAWLWLSAVANDDAEREEFLRQVVAINPQHPTAAPGLQKLVEQRRAKLSAQVAALAAAQSAAAQPIEPAATSSGPGWLRLNPATSRRVRLQPRTRRMIFIGGGIFIALLAVIVLPSVLGRPTSGDNNAINPVSGTGTPSAPIVTQTILPATWTATPSVTSTVTLTPTRSITATAATRTAVSTLPPSWTPTPAKTVSP